MDHEMDSQQLLKPHVTIRKGFSFPPLQKCNDCCVPGKFHCPFCSPAFFKPTKRCRVMDHLETHLNRAFFCGKYTIHRCSLGCRLQAHFHCLYCTATLIRKRDFSNHLPLCRQTQLERAQEERDQLWTNATQRIQSDGLTPGLTFLYDTESDDDDDKKTTTPDSEDQNSDEASSSQSVIPTVRKSIKCESLKCHRTVQTDIGKPQDCDEYYFMSLVKLFKRLSPQKKAKVRMKIERLLLEAEFE